MYDLLSSKYLFNMSFVNLMICCRLERLCNEVTYISSLMTTEVYVQGTFFDLLSYIVMHLY